MCRVLLSFFVLLLMAVSLQCGSSSQLQGLSIGDIQIEGDHAEEVKAELEEALLAAGATLHQAGQPNLVGKLTWEWAGQKDRPYPTSVKVFMQSESEENKLTISTQYQVPVGAQPQGIEHYRAQIVERIVGRIAAQSSGAS